MKCCNAKNFDREINLIMKGQHKSGVSSISAMMAGMKPEENEMPAKGVNVSNFEKGQWSNLKHKLTQNFNCK